MKQCVSLIQNFFQICTVFLFLHSSVSLAQQVQVKLAPRGGEPKSTSAKSVKLSPAVNPLPEPQNKSMPSAIPIYPGAKAVGFRPNSSNDNRHVQVGNYIVTDSIEKVAAFYKTHITGENGRRGVTIVSLPNGLKMAQGWFHVVVRGTYVFRILMKSPGYDLQKKDLNPALTELQFYMDARAP